MAAADGLRHRLAVRQPNVAVVSGQAANTYAPRASPDRSIPSQTLLPRALSITTSVIARKYGLGNVLALFEARFYTPLTLWTCHDDGPSGQCAHAKKGNGRLDRRRAARAERGAACRGSGPGAARPARQLLPRAEARARRGARQGRRRPARLSRRPRRRSGRRPTERSPCSSATAASSRSPSRRRRRSRSAGRPASFSALRRGMVATVIRDGDAPATEVRATR